MVEAVLRARRPFEKLTENVFDAVATLRYGLRYMISSGEPHNSPQRVSVKVGDTVAYSKKFLQSVCQLTGPMPYARGQVVAMVPLRQTMLAKIEWENDDLPDKVNTANLSLVRDGVVMDLDSRRECITLDATD
jgi:hypothetical protein